MTTKIASTLVLGNLGNECGNLIIRIDDLNVHVLCLSFNTTQLYRWVILNLLAHIFKKEVVDTYQL